MMTASLARRSREQALTAHRCADAMGVGVEAHQCETSVDELLAAMVAERPSRARRGGLDIPNFLIRASSRRRRFEAIGERLSIKVADPEAPITLLSGGDQQKVLLARLLASHPSALLLNDPTRGVDVATRRAFYEVFRELAKEGMTIVILSSELHELTALCDRVLVFREQEVTARLTSAQMTSEAIISAMFGEAA